MKENEVDPLYLEHRVQPGIIDPLICYQLGETAANRVPAGRDRVKGWFSIAQEGLRTRRAMRAMALRAKATIGT